MNTAVVVRLFEAPSLRCPCICMRILVIMSAVLPQVNLAELLRALADTTSSSMSMFLASTGIDGNRNRNRAGSFGERVAVCLPSNFMVGEPAFFAYITFVFLMMTALRLNIPSSNRGPCSGSPS